MRHTLEFREREQTALVGEHATRPRKKLNNIGFHVCECQHMRERATACLHLQQAVRWEM